MSVPFHLSADGWTLPTNVEEFLPTGGVGHGQRKAEIPFDEFNDSDITTDWTVLNPGSADSIAEGSGVLTIDVNATNSQLLSGINNCPGADRAVTGNFDRYCRINARDFINNSEGFAFGLTKSSGDVNDYYFPAAFHIGTSRYCTRLGTIRSAGGTRTFVDQVDTLAFDVPYELRLRRVGETLTGFFRHPDDTGWTQIGTEVLVGWSSTAFLALVCFTFNTANACVAKIDWVRNIAPFDSVSRESESPVIAADGTLVTTGAIFPVFDENDALLAESSTLFKIAVSVNAGAYTAFKTVDEYQALADFTPSVSLRFKYQFNGTTAQGVKVLDAQVGAFTESGVAAASVPVIAFVSKTATTVTFAITNTGGNTVEVFSFLPGATVGVSEGTRLGDGNITITSLVEGTAYGFTAAVQE